MPMRKANRAPLFHIAKRAALPWQKAWAIRGVALVLALIVCALITTLLTGENPIDIYAAILDGGFGTARKTWVLFQNLAVLLCISLAVTPAFKMRFWNIGAEGQVLAGALACAACMICLRNVLPNWAIILCMIVSSIAAGAVWAAIPGFFKAHWNTNETLFTLMMNYIATQLVAYFVILWEVPKGAGKIGIINQTSQAGWLPQIGEYRYLLTIVVVAVLTVLLYIYLNYSKHGYEIAVVGESERRHLRRGGPAAGRQHGAHAHHHHRRRARLYGGHGFVAGQVQPDLHDLYELPARAARPRRKRDLHGFWPQPVVCRHPDGRDPVLHHRQRVLHQLSNPFPPGRKACAEGGRRPCLISSHFSRVQ